MLANADQERIKGIPGPRALSLPLGAGLRLKCSSSDGEQAADCSWTVRTVYQLAIA